MCEHTGLFDSDGRGILIGSIVRTQTTINTEFHGDWADYKVIQRGMTPVVSYLRSEKGEMLPEGYLSRALHTYYDAKLFLFSTKLDNIRPIGRLIVVNEEE